VGAQVVCEQAATQIERLCRCSADSARRGLHARPLGSFCRGAKTTGDIDVMIIPGDHLPWVCPVKLLSAILLELHANGIVTHDVALPQHSTNCSCSQRGSATWLGVCYVPGASTPSIPVWCFPTAYDGFPDCRETGLCSLLSASADSVSASAGPNTLVCMLSAHLAAVHACCRCLAQPSNRACGRRLPKSGEAHGHQGVSSLPAGDSSQLLFRLFAREPGATLLVWLPPATRPRSCCQASARSRQVPPQRPHLFGESRAGDVCCCHLSLLGFVPLVLLPFLLAAARRG
jgi:hypothetical protein